MESLQNSCSSNELGRQTSLDRLAGDIKNLQFVSSPATVTSMLDHPDEEEAPYRTSGQILSCDDMNHAPSAPNVAAGGRLSNDVDDPRSCDENVPAIFMHPSMAEDDEAICIIRMLQNSTGCSYRITTSAFLPYYIPPETKNIRGEKPFFCFMAIPTMNPSSPSEAVAPCRPCGIVLTGRALLWACARSADLLPSEPQDVMIAFGIWSKVLNLLKRVRVTKSKPEQSSRNHHLRCYILELKDIERDLNQICSPGQNCPAVLGGGVYSFADYAVARVFELLLDDTSFFRLPYTRQKKYARIIEIASHVQYYRSRVTGAMIEDWRPPNKRPSSIRTWEEIVQEKLDRDLFIGEESWAQEPWAQQPVSSPEATTASARDLPSESPRPSQPQQSNDHDSDTDFENKSAENWPSQSSYGPFSTDEAQHKCVRAVPRKCPDEFIYFCYPTAPLRYFLYKFGLTVARRHATWHDLAEGTWHDQSGIFTHNFMAIYSQLDQQDRCCWSLADMFAHKRLYHHDSLAEQLAIQILERYLEPEVKPISEELLTQFDAALQMESTSRLLLPAIAIEQMKNFGQQFSAYPRICRGIDDPSILNFIANLA